MILGDLEEEYYLRRQRADANRWYWTESLLSAGVLLPRRVLASEARHDLGAAAVGVASIILGTVLLAAVGLGEAAVLAEPPWDAVLATLFYAGPCVAGGIVVGLYAPRPWVGATVMLLGAFALSRLVVGLHPTPRMLLFWSFVTVFTASRYRRRSIRTRQKASPDG